MNFKDTKKSVLLVLATGEVPLIVGDSGIGKTALAKELAVENGWRLVVIDGNLLKEGEIGGLPTVETYVTADALGNHDERKMTVYAVHHKLRMIDDALSKGNKVLLFIDEMNRCEHTVQQELMNLILNKEINGYQLDENVKIVAAMNPSDKYGSDFDYQVVDMDAAQENRFVWLFMEPDYRQWLSWATEIGIEEKVIAFISTFPEYLYKINEASIRATPRSYERISKAYAIYKNDQVAIPRSVFLNVLKGNVGKLIAEEFMNFIEHDYVPMIAYEDVFNGLDLSSALALRIQAESHTRLYLAAINILKILDANVLSAVQGATNTINRLIAFLKIYPVDLRVGIMKEMKNTYGAIYKHAIENEAFIELYFETYEANRG